MEAANRAVAAERARFDSAAAGRPTSIFSRFPPIANALLVQQQRLVAEKFNAPPELSSRFWSLAGSRPAGFISALADLSFAVHGMPGVPWFSMGHPVVANRVPGDFFCARASAAANGSRRTAIAAGALAAALAALPVDVRIGLREAAQRRSHVAELHRADLSLRNPTVTNLDWLVCPSIAGLGAKSFHDFDVWHRARRSIFDFRAEAVAPLCLPPRLSRFRS